MKKKNMNPEILEESEAPVKQSKKKKKKGSGFLGRLIRRFFLLLFTVIILIAVALVLVMNMVFNGPSKAAQEVLTMSLIEASATKWVPALFIGEERVAEIQSSQCSCRNQQLCLWPGWVCTARIFSSVASQVLLDKWKELKLQSPLKSKSPIQGTSLVVSG